MKLEDFTEEQKEKALKCETADELLALAKEEGIELTDEDLEMISGGFKWGDTCFLHCKSGR